MRFPSVLLLGVVCLIAPILPMSAADVPAPQALSPADARKRFNELKAAAEKGDPEAQQILGLAYAIGEGVGTDPIEAVRWFRLAAEHGSAKAQNSLGLCYEHGQGVEKNTAEAVKWYQRAAEQGLAEAQHNFGVSHTTGEGVKKDAVEAYAWFTIAARTLPPATTARDRLGKQMSPEQIMAAQKRTKELLKMIEEKMANGVR